jgi:NAD(P)-dependent dehydrogenase (short-subunit alcohol dehydrogenase family)
MLNKAQMHSLEKGSGYGKSSGASRGIGRVTARRLAKDGFSVVVNYAGNTAMAQDVVNEIKEVGYATAIQADISNSEDVQHLFTETKQQYGRIDVVVNNAGIMGLARLRRATSTSSTKPSQPICVERSWCLRKLHSMSPKAGVAQGGDHSACDS